MMFKFYQKHIFPHLLNQVMQVPSLMDRRRELLLPLSGDILEIGFGTGLNLAFYQNVENLYALEPNLDIYQLALDRIRLTPFHVKHIHANAQHLPFANHCLDHIVSTWTMCSIENLPLALQEIHRVLKPTGTLHLLEHVRHPDNSTIQHLQDWLTPIQKRLADGCHLNRNIEQILQSEHFNLTTCHYFDADGIPKIGQRMLLARAQPL